MRKMGIIKKPLSVKPFCAVLFRKEENLNLSLSFLIDIFGSIDIKSEIFPFDFTDYYSKEMGENLKKIFVSFENLLLPDDCAQWKIHTNDIEKKLSLRDDSSRTVNIDPGYVELSKVVLLTTKNFSHRIYLDKGIYAEVTLIWSSGRFNSLAWTYPDYKTEPALNFFSRIREKLKTGSTLDS